MPTHPVHQPLPLNVCANIATVGDGSGLLYVVELDPAEIEVLVKRGYLDPRGQREFRPD